MLLLLSDDTKEQRAVDSHFIRYDDIPRGIFPHISSPPDVDDSRGVQFDGGKNGVVVL